MGAASMRIEWRRDYVDGCKKTSGLLPSCLSSFGQRYGQSEIATRLTSAFWDSDRLRKAAGRRAKTPWAATQVLQWQVQLADARVLRSRAVELGGWNLLLSEKSKRSFLCMQLHFLMPQIACVTPHWALVNHPSFY